MSWDEIEGKDKEKQTYTKLPEGNSLIRVLDGEPFSFWNHWMQAQKTGVSCLGRDCPICAVMAQQKADKLPAQYSSSQRHAVRVWNYATNQMEILIQGRQFFQQLLVFHREVGDVRGYDMKIIRKGTDTSTTYTMIPQPAKPFEHEGEVTDVDFADLFKPIDKATILLLMEGKTWEQIKELNGLQEDN